MKTVAEFVENGEITKILMELGVDYMQGYYFGKPENCRVWLNDGEYKADK
ncbi:MAG: EAL domain-containing protein [Alphaproteobacteria bacterium]